MQQTILVVPREHWVRGLDSLRFVLALIVFLSHLENFPAAFFKSFDNTALKFIGIVINHLYLGPGAVIAFFIISGFVIHYPMKGKPLNVKQFLIRRWVRIGIPMVVAFLIALGFERGIWLIPAWSLYCELIYYTIYPLFRKLPISWQAQFRISFVIAIILVLSLGGTELQSLLSQSNISYTGSYAMLGNFLTWLIGLPCWLIGVLIAEKIDLIKRTVSTSRIWIIRIMMLMMSIIIVGLKAHWFVSYLFTLNIIAPIVGYWIACEILYFRTHEPWCTLECAGKFSYSLYLLHVVIATSIGMWLPRSLATYPLFIIITVFLAWMFYLLIEAPSHKLSRYLASRAVFTSKTML